MNVGYCTVQDVLNPFPRFVQALPNNITTAAIQSWVDLGKAEIRARFLRRKLDPDLPATLGWSPPLSALTTDQANVLLKFNAAYGIGRFGDAAYNQMNDGELRVVARAWAEWESMILDTDGESSRHILGNDGVFDTLFSPSAAHVQVAPIFGGRPGADFDPRVINDSSMGTFHMFEKAKRF